MQVLLVDDHPLILEILPAIIRKEFGEADVVCTGGLAEALAHARKAELDLAIVDLGLPGLTGIEALRQFRAAQPKLRVVILSAIDDAQTIQRCLELGAAGYIPKRSKPRVIAAALRVVAEGGTYVPDEILQTRRRRGTRAQLSARQQAVMRLILEGYSNRRIAEELSIAESTVKQHASDIYAAFGVSSRAELQAAASDAGTRRDGRK